MQANKPYNKSQFEGLPLENNTVKKSTQTNKQINKQTNQASHC